MDVLYEDERIIVVDKPHFLATMPRGMWYRQTALIRLRERLGEPDITPAHRLDRMTAGVLVFVQDPACRGAYQMLFQNRQAVKIYECLAPCRPISGPRFGTIMQVEPPRPFPLLRRSHITKEHGTMAAFEEPGLANAETLIERGDLCFPPAGGRRREAPEGSFWDRLQLFQNDGSVTAPPTQGSLREPFRICHNRLFQYAKTPGHWTGGLLALWLPCGEGQGGRS